MSDSEAPASTMRTPPPYSQWQPPGRGGLGATSSKRRDSCHACAVSKVKCPKEKPACARCENRGIACQYFLMKRPGRRRESESNRQQNNKHNNGHNSTAPSVTSTRTSILDTESETGNRPRDADTIRAAAPPFGTLGFLPDSPTAPTATLPDVGTSNGNNSNLFSLTPSSVTNSITNNIPTPPQSEKTLTGGDGLSDMFSVLGETIRMRELAEFNMNAEVGDMDFAMSAMDFVMSTMDSPFEFPALNSGSGDSHDDISSLLMPVEMATSNNNIDPALSETSSSSMDLTTNAGGGNQADPFGLSPPPFHVSGAIVSTPKTSPTLSAVITENATSCKCLVKSLDLLKTLSSGPHCSVETGLHDARGADTGSSTGTDATAMTGEDSLARITLRENEQSIEAVISILGCKSCADDGFLLTVSSMIVLKILDRYAAAARHQSSSSSSPRASTPPRSASGGGGGLDGSCVMLGNMSKPDAPPRCRASAQIVLSELHRVQRLVNELSPKLRGFGAAARNDLGYFGRGGEHHHLGLVTTNDTEKKAPPLSPGTLEQVEADLRKNLRTLSEEIINVLRQL